jgi:hypothetical protein
MRRFLDPAKAAGALVVVADDGGRSGTERRAIYDAEIARRLEEAGGRHRDVDVRVSLMWNTVDDVDLHVTAPSGETIFHGNRRSRCGGRLDVDRNVASTTREPVENVRWEQGKAPAGTYGVTVRNHAFRSSARRPIDFTVEIVTGGEVQRHRGTVSKRGETGPDSDIEVAKFRFDPEAKGPAAAQGGEVAAAMAREDAGLNPQPNGCPDPKAELAGIVGAGARLFAVTPGSASSPFSDLQGAKRLRLANQEDLVAAADTLASQGFGRRGLTHGGGRGRVEVRIPEHTGRAWILVSGDGDLTEIRPSRSNPSAARVELDVASGETKAVNGRDCSGYRVLRLIDPQAGTWRFDFGAGVALGWLLETQRRIEVRPVGGQTLYRDRESVLALELFDPATGEAVTDPDTLSSAAVIGRLDGAQLAFKDDGQGGDAVSADGRFSALVYPRSFGAIGLQVTLRTAGQERHSQIRLQVFDSAWRFRPALPAIHGCEIPLFVSGRIEPGERASSEPPREILAALDDARISLRDDGLNGDAAVGDGVYSAHWTPARSGHAAVRFEGIGGAPVEVAQSSLEILDWAEPAGSEVLDFGTLVGDREATTELDLSGSVRGGRADVELSAEPFVPVELTVEGAGIGGPRHLVPGQPMRVPLVRGADRWRLRIAPQRCPPRLDGRSIGTLRVRGQGRDGQVREIALSLRAISEPRPLFHCLLPLLIAAALALLAAFLVWGFVSPARFSRSLGILVSPEEDLDEGFLQLVRTARGTGSGFYRDARAYIAPEFRVSGRRAGALVCLIAGRGGVLMRRLAGQAVLRRNPQGEWEALAEVELRPAFGELFRNEGGTLYFELRNV